MSGLIVGLVSGLVSGLVDDVVKNVVDDVVDAVVSGWRHSMEAWVDGIAGWHRWMVCPAGFRSTPITNCRRPLGWLQEGAGRDRRRARNDATLGVGRRRQRREDAPGPADNRNLVDNPGVGQPRSVERGAGP